MSIYSDLDNVDWLDWSLNIMRILIMLQFAIVKLEKVDIIFNTLYHYLVLVIIFQEKKEFKLYRYLIK